MSGALAGKVAVITGSGQGIGRAIAIGLAREGVRIVTNNRCPGSTGNVIMSESLLGALDSSQRRWLQEQSEALRGDAETTAATIVDAGGEAIPVFGDIADFEVGACLARAALEKYGGLDIVINVAGAFGFSPIWDISESMWDRVTATKPKGYFNVIRHAAPQMMKQGWGRIINCASRAFVGDRIKHAEYCAANAGVVGLTRAAAIELAPYGITCNAFAPFAMTRASLELEAHEMAASAGESAWIDRQFAFPLAMTPDADCLVPFIAYLAGDDANGVSGSVFSVGGNTISLWSEPQIARSMTKAGGGHWTVAEIAKQAPVGLLDGYRSTVM